MARLISKATGNFTNAATWGLVDDTSYLDSEAGSTALTTSFVYSQTFTPGAITIDGVAIKILDVGNIGAGLITLELNNHTDTIVVDTVAIASQDIANTSAGSSYNRGWYFFKFASSQLLVAGKAYKIGLKTANVSTAGVTPYRNASAGNWSRMLRTTTTQAPASGDQLHVIGELTGSGTGNDITVTMDNTATTIFGPTVSGGPPQGITIGKRGELTCGTTASTNYYLKWKGVMAVYDSGILNIGTSGTRIPSNSTVVLEMDSAVAVDTGLDIGIGSTLNIYGHNAFTTTFKTLLNTNGAIADTVIGVESTSGWANGDEIVLAATGRVPSETEKRTISTVDSGVQVTISSGLSNAHSGTSPLQAEVVNLTRNVKIRGISSTLTGYINIASHAVVNIQYAEMTNLGSATSLKRGMDVATTTGTFNCQYCSFYNYSAASSVCINITSTSGSNITVSNNAFYLFYRTAISNVATSGVQIFDNNIAMLSTNTAVAIGLFEFGDAGSTYTNLTVIGAAFLGGSGGALQIAEVATLGTINNIVAHSNQCSGFRLAAFNGSVSNITSWRNVSAGVKIQCKDVVFDNVVTFGNLYGVDFETFSSDCEIKNFEFSGDTTWSSNCGVSIAANTSATSMGSVGPIYFTSGTMGVVTGIKVAHVAGDIAYFSASGVQSLIFFRNCVFASTTEAAFITPAFLSGSWFFSQKHDQTINSHKAFGNYGIITLDTTIYKTTSPSMRMTPSSSTAKLTSGPVGYNFHLRVDSGSTISPVIYVRESKVSSGDAATYNGARARLIARKNVPLGISSDTVLATATSASEGAWELLRGTTPVFTDNGVLEIYIDCDGTTGWINVDELNGYAMQEWRDGLPHYDSVRDSASTFVG